MTALRLHEVHAALGARFSELSGMEIVADYGDSVAEYAALRDAVGVCDLGFRGRLCLTGADRVRLLNGQVTNDIRALDVGRGCAAAFCSPKGRLVADVTVFALSDDLLLDFEPGLTAALTERLEHHIVAEDVQVVDVEPYYGLLTFQGPQTAALVQRLELFPGLPAEKFAVATVSDPTLGDLYLIHRPRAASPGADLFVPVDSQEAVLDRAAAAARELGGRLAGFDALDLRRFEAGIPRFPVDMDASNLPPEAGLDLEAISYSKGCYTGQETIARIRTYGQVAKALRGLRLPDLEAPLPVKGDPVLRNGREVGYVTSARFSPALNARLALAYVRREANVPGTELTLRAAGGEMPVQVMALPFLPMLMDAGEPKKGS
ncbi:MAG: aminomethyltransferase family protein [Verrucomicrobiae bacterium]|nr:aminomethyltransferase family protein [Verrucomicrobiae bacterium]